MSTTTPPESPRSPDPEEPRPLDQPSPADGRVLYVRSGRSLSLGGWVVIALALSAIAGAVLALVTGETALGSIVYLAVTAVMFLGLPLAGIIALVDLVLERRRRRR